jgi:uncharacterized protein YjbJ (UPF0337 family)
MILLQQLRRFFLSMRFTVLLVAVIVFSFTSGESWAATSFTPGVIPLNPQIAAMNQAKVMSKKAEGKAEEALGKMTGDLKTQATGKAKQLKVKTQEGLDNSIVNPDYQPSGKIRQPEKEIRQATDDLEAQAREKL